MFVWSLDGRRRVRAGFWLALPAVALGLFAVYELTSSLFFDRATGFHVPDWGDVLSTLMVLFFASPLLIAGIFGTRLLRRTTRYDVKGALITILVVAFVFGWYSLESLLVRRFQISESQADNWSQLLFMIAAVAIYAGVGVWVLRRDGIPSRGIGEFYGSVAALLIAWTILVLGIEIVSEHTDLMFKQPEGAVLGFLPFFAAWLFYRVSFRIVHGKRPPRREPGTFQLRPPGTEP